LTIAVGRGVMPLPIYAKSLVRLLRTLGVDQQEIARQLRLSKSTVSLWATGARPLAKRHEQPFLDLVEATIREHQTRADVSETDLRDIASYLHAWSREMYIQVGRFRRTIQEHFQTLQSPLSKVDPLTLSRDERFRLKWACRQLVMLLDAIDQLEGDVPIQRSTTTALDPMEQFRLWRQMYDEFEPREEE
jgi:transcriptional regulator with XRE-family HTH domain